MTLPAYAAWSWGYDPTIQDRGVILPIPDATGAPTLPMWLTGLAEAVSAPAYAAQGGTPTTQDMLNMSLALAGTGSTRALTRGAEQGATELGMFMPPTSMGRKIELVKAKNAGATNEDLWNDYGALWGAPGSKTSHSLQWGMLDNSNAGFREPVSTAGANLSLEQLLSAPTLTQAEYGAAPLKLGTLPLGLDEVFARDPKLADIQLVQLPKTALYNGSWFADPKAIAIKPNGDITNTLLHELQHAVQDNNSWARGGTSARMYSKGEKQTFEDIVSNWDKFKAAAKEYDLGVTSPAAMDDFAKVHRPETPAQNTLAEKFFTLPSDVQTNVLDYYMRGPMRMSELRNMQARTYNRYLGIPGEMEAREAALGRGQTTYAPYRIPESPEMLDWANPLVINMRNNPAEYAQMIDAYYTTSLK